MSLKDIAKLLSAPLTPANSVIPKNRRSILIYSNLGLRDNAGSLYDYLISHGYNSRYRITVGCEDHKELTSSAPENVRFVSPARALFTFLRCGYMFYSFGKFPVMPAKKQTVVNLWHGMPLKTVGSLEKDRSFDGKCFFTYTIATSPLFEEIMSKCFCCPRDKVLLTGQPRCDKLFEKNAGKKKLILWLPTYRTSERLRSRNSQLSGSTGLPTSDTAEKLKRLDGLLSELGFKLVIKPHPLQDPSGQLPKFKNIAFISEKTLRRRKTDIYDLMKMSCALITDYSSVSFDYLLLDRPIAYTLDDLDSYSDQRGFTVADPLSLMAGEHITGIDGLCGFIRDTAAGKDKYRAERRELNNIVNSAQDGHSCERILAECGIE